VHSSDDEPIQSLNDVLALMRDADGLGSPTEGLRLIHAFRKIKDKALRQQVIDLAESLAQR